MFEGDKARFPRFLKNYLKLVDRRIVYEASTVAFYLPKIMRHAEPRPEDLVASFRSGDKWAMEYLYGLHNRTLCYFASNLTRDRELAEEIVSDTFVKLFRLRSNFDSHTNIRAFLYITVRNACFNAIRQSKRLTKAQEEMLYLMQNESDHQEFDDIETSLLQKVYEEIETLP